LHRMKELPYLLKCRVQDNEEGRDRLIETHWQLIAAIAWAGYMQTGAGVVFLDFANSEPGLTGTGLGMVIFYCEQNVLSFAGFLKQTGVAEGLQLYNPASEVYLAMLGRDGIYLFETRASNGLLPDPPEAYRRQQKMKPGIDPRQN
jgi:hypothetical protein